jgi:hypothetical protein
MVDSRAKGRTAVTNAKKLLREHTKHKWERVPGSGALAPVHGLKGDLYIPKLDNFYCVEVKHYKEDQFTSKILSGSNPLFLQWWAQAERQAEQTDKAPLLMFKYDRSKWFTAFDPTCNAFEYHSSTIPHYFQSIQYNEGVCSQLIISRAEYFIEWTNNMNGWIVKNEY